MDKELNKYFPNDISNMIVKMVYKSMYDDVMKQFKKDFVLQYCNYPTMFEYRRLVFLNNWRRTRWIVKLYYHVKQRRLKYHQFYKKIIHDSKYDFMKILRYYLSAGDEVVLNRMSSLFFMTCQRTKMARIRYNHLLKVPYYNSL